MKAAFFFALLFCNYTLSAQFLDQNFSQTDLSGWLGDRDHFQLLNDQLQLHHPSPGSDNLSYLSYPALTDLSLTSHWEAYLQLDFAPSSRNFSRFYLSASRADLTGALNGYFLQVGGEDGSQDGLALYRQDGEKEVLLLKATPGAVATRPVTVRVRISRSPPGLWQLEADYQGGENYEPAGEVNDLTYPRGRFIGFWCRYSSTRADDFAFDDLLVGPLSKDTQPPTLLSVETLSNRQLVLHFDEPLLPASATQPGNYTLNGGLGAPSSTELSASDPAQVHLCWQQSFTDLTEYILTVSAITDVYGNTSDVQVIRFTYVELIPPSAEHLILTEIMAAPTDDLGLPKAEYLEIYNRGKQAIDLDGMGIASGSSPKILPAYILFPDQYLILTDEEAAPALAAFGPTLGIPNFPGLTNTSDQIRITSPDEEVIVELSYDQSWYGDAQKADGGWSLELVQPDAPLNCADNWRASISLLGGTPGAVNSVWQQNLTSEGPILISAFAESELEVTLRFDKALDVGQAGATAHYRIEPDIQIAAADPQADPREVLLLLDTPLLPEKIYEVTLTSGLTDCLGNPANSSVSKRLGLANTPVPGQLVINELLFFPAIGGAAFLEVYNRSDQVIDLQGMLVHILMSDGNARTASIQQPIVLFPKEYAVISPDPLDILDRYTVKFPGRLWKNKLPSFGPSGTLSLINASAEVLDAFNFSGELHAPLLDDERGVSLERIDSEAATNAAGNWHSAAGTIGFATPTYENSQAYSTTVVTEGQLISLSHNRFSPDGDGFEDILLMHYQTDRPGYHAQVQIFDMQGRLVKRLLRNELLAGQGILKWDGSTDTGQKARLGIYILWIEVIHPDGRIQRQKATCVLAGRLR